MFCGQIQKKVNEFLNNKNFELTIIVLILINLAIFIFQTDVQINAKCGVLFTGIETVSVIVFTVEYLLRIITLKNIKDVFSFYMLVDLFAILPFYLSFMNLNAVFIRVFRLFRLFRILKITRYSTAIMNLQKSFVKRKHELIVTGFIFIIALILSSIFIYLAEHNTGVEQFSSIPKSFWWSVITFTTVGYGDAYPVTALGKLIASITAIFGVGLHGLLIGVLSTAIFDVISKDEHNESETSGVTTL